ncbi:alpha/beta hydrolase [Streptomyces beihaiensis]|uniref:Alpha/beta fold hydrolase n=1 Tax=Streptomyces beihaiensis TaxID=2984495 RepID=A0ABT3TQV6_9ACTN|nr:alpha/beta hydrolase [Streptomyces beihaiensis]MCX3059406.1 alpha/beta fold hydrolase [Streptomyces beihaiensis]
MSRPATFTPPPGVRAHRLATARGDFATLVAEPQPGRPVRGTALLLPGFTGSKEDFIALHGPLSAAGYRTVAVDGRGQYESAGPRDDEAPYAQDELARDVLAQAAALAGQGRAEVGPKLHLLGHSLGGLIARAAVIADPAPFATVTLMSSGPAAVTPSQQERVKLLRDALATLDMAEVWEAMQAFAAAEGDTDAGITSDGAGITADGAGITADARGSTADGAGITADATGSATGTGDSGDSGDDGRDGLRQRWLRNSPAQLIATGRQLCGEPNRVAELAETLSAAGVAAHVLSGERDDVWPVPLLDEMARRLGAERSVISGAEHSPNTDRPEPTAAALAAFWDRHPHPTR